VDAILGKTGSHYAARVLYCIKLTSTLQSLRNGTLNLAQIDTCTDCYTSRTAFAIIC